MTIQNLLLSETEYPGGSAQADHPNCGACPGDGSICKSTCKVVEDSPPIPTSSAQPVTGVQEQDDREQFRLINSIIHKCPAIRLPQSFLQKIGNASQIVVLKGADAELARFIVDACNATQSPKAQPVLTDAQIESAAKEFFYQADCPGNELLERIYPADMVKFACTIIAATGARPASDFDALHGDIMNIKCRTPDEFSTAGHKAYKYGHRDARHAAAELVAAMKGLV